MNFNDLQKNPSLIAKKEQEIREVIAKELGIPMEEVLVMSITAGSVHFDVVIPAIYLSKISDEVKSIQQKIYKLKNKLSKTFTRLNPRFISVAPVLTNLRDQFQISSGDFDARGDFKFPKVNGEKQRRGGLEYYQPCNKWKRLGLRVLGLYEDDRWLSMNGGTNEWAVGFHGPNGKIDSFKGIAHSRMFCLANANGWGGKVATNKQTPIPLPGIYFAQDIEKCYHSPINIGGKLYKIAFQCRVHPDHVWLTGNSNTWFVVDNPIYVRPYGIVVQEM
jgi:hypothetical protein